MKIVLLSEGLIEQPEHDLFLDYAFQLQSVAQCYSDNRSVMLIAEAIFPLVCTTIPIKRVSDRSMFHLANAVYNCRTQLRD